MSFSREVKEELIGRMPSQAHCRRAELCGFLVYRGELLPDGTLEFVCDNQGIAKKVFTFLKKSYNIGLAAMQRKVEGRVRTEHVVRIPDSDETSLVLNSLGLGTSLERPGRLSLLQEECLERSCCKRSFLRAAYCMAGTMNDPKKSLHFEIAAPEQSVGRILSELMDSFGLAPKVTERRGITCLYRKDGDGISDMLNIMEAHASLLRYESERAMREVHGNVNRKVNIEVSNLRKTAKASEKQIRSIQLINDTTGLGSLPEELSDIAKLRLENPEASLTELGEMLTPPLRRSGVNHRLQKLCDIAEDLARRSKE